MGWKQKPGKENRSFDIPKDKEFHKAIEKQTNRLYNKQYDQRGFEMIKGSAHEEDTTILTTDICNNKASEYVNRK